MFSRIKRVMHTHLFKYLFVLMLIFAWVFSGVPQIFRDPDIPPHVQEARAAIIFKDDFEFDTVQGRNPKIVQVSGSTYAIVYYNGISLGGGGFIRTVSIDSLGNISGLSSSRFEFDLFAGRQPDIIQVSGDLFAVVYHDANDNSGFVRTIRISSSGIISSLSSRVKYDDVGENPDIIKIAGNIFAIAYTGPAFDGYVRTISINISTGVPSLVGGSSFVEFDTTNAETPRIIYMSGTSYAIVYAGPSGDDGMVKRVSIDSSGQVSLISGEVNFNTVGRTPTISHVSGNVYAIAYSGPSTSGVVETLTINPTGSIGGSIEEFIFDSSRGQAPSIISIGGGNYAVAYTGPSDDGFLKTFPITSSGDIGSVIDTLEYDPDNSQTPVLIHVTGTIYGVAYEGQAEDGWIKTYDLGSVPPPPPAPDIKADGSNGPITISYNGSAVISWTSSDATSCSVSPCPPGPPSTGSCTDLNNSGPGNGRGTGNLTSSQTYTLSCTGPGGSASDSVTVSVPSPSTTNPGMIAYDQDGATAPSYRLWSGSDLGSELSGIPKESGHGEDYFLDLEHSPVYNQKIFTEQTSNGHIRAMIWNGITSSWSLGANAPANGDFATFSQVSATSRAYGVAYEGLSGQALLVYENSASSDRSFGYAVWNGANWSTGIYNYEAGGCPAASGFFIDDRVQWMKAKGQVNGNDILVWFSTRDSPPGQRDGYALIWKGDTNTFANCRDMTNNVGLITTTPAENFDIAWETSSKDAMVVWGQSQFYSYKTFSGGVWSATTGIVVDMVNDVQSMELASDAASDYIAFIGADLQTTNDMEVRMWNGSSWTSVAVPDQLGNGSSSLEHVNTHRVAVVWESGSDQALFAFTKNGNSYIDYFMYDHSDNRFFCPENNQTVTDLDNAEGSNGPCNTSNIQTWKSDVGAIRLASDPLANTIFLMAVNDVSPPIQLEVLVWRGDVNGFSLPLTNIPEGDVSPGSFINPQAYAFDFAFNFGTAAVPFADCGLRYHHTSGTVMIACDVAGTLTSALRIRKSGATHGVILVPITDPNASPIRIRTNTGIKALREL